MEPSNGVSGLVIFFIACYFVYLIYVVQLNELLKEVKPENRGINKNAVWPLLFCIVSLFSYLPMDLGFKVPNLLNYLVSLFFTIYQFILVFKISDSVEKEFVSRGILMNNKPILTFGIWMSVSDFVYYLVIYNTSYTILGVILFVAFVVFFILYWINIYKVKKELINTPESEIPGDSIFKDL